MRVTIGCNFAGATPDGFYWVASDNNAQVPFTVADLIGLYQLIWDRENVAFDKLQALKSQIRAAKTVNDVEAVLWD
ncbi:hypothetical protein OKW35_001799 [Paraburkholderia sp. MM5477-R1]